MSLTLYTNGFLVQSSSHLSIWDCSVWITRSRIYHAWAPLNDSAFRDSTINDSAFKDSTLNDSMLSNCIPHLYLGGQVRRASCPHFKPRPPVHLFPFGWASPSCWEYSMCRPPPTIHNPTGWRRGLMVSWRLPPLRARLAGSRWPEHLPRVLLGLRATPKEDCGVSAAELVYWAALSLLAEFLSTSKPPAGEFLRKLQHVEMPATRPLTYAKVAAKPPPALLQASHLYVWRGGKIPPLLPLSVGPSEVLERAGKFFRIAVGSCEETVSIDHLRPHLGAGPFSAALPAARSRPPSSAPVVHQAQQPPAASSGMGPCRGAENPGEETN
jgi:hypothetical protein